MTQIAICEDPLVEKSNRLLSYVKAEAQKKSCAKILHEPQKAGGSRVKFSRITLNVAAPKNVGSDYCDKINAKHTKDAFTSAREAIAHLRVATRIDPRLRAVRIAGKGDPLASEVTFEVLDVIQKELPHLTRCVVTDGLLLPRKLQSLKEAGVSAVTVNVNAVDADVGSQIYRYITLNGKTLCGKEAFEVLSINQLEGLRNAADAGFMVEVNAAYIPGVNSKHLVEVARIVRSLGAYVLNIEPLVSSRYDGLNLPSMEELAQVRRDCEIVCASEVILYAPSVPSIFSPAYSS